MLWAEQSWHLSWQVARDVDGWTLEKRDESLELELSIKKYEGLGNIFRFKVTDCIQQSPILII